MAAAGLCRLLLAFVCVGFAQARFLVEQGGLKVRELEPWPPLAMPSSALS